MGLRQIRIATLLLLTLLCSTSVLAIAPIESNVQTSTLTPSVPQLAEVSESLLNLSIPYVDTHYGSADGIIDPTEYASSYTDPTTGITVYLEQNSTILFVGLEADTQGWIAIGWKNYTDDFRSEGVNNSDLIYGYAPGNPHDDVPRVVSSDSVTVQYELYIRNGTLKDSGTLPTDESTSPIADESLLQGYKDAIIGMRIGETKRFIIPAEEGYNQPTNPLYGEDLEFIITLTRINSNHIDPAAPNQIVYNDEHGISTFHHLPDANQSRILAANGRDDSFTTSLEYFIEMNSTDPEDIPLLNGTDMSYPIILLSGGPTSEDTTELPAHHSEWATPPRISFEINTPPEIIINSPENNEVVAFATQISLNITADSYVRRTFYKFSDENWTEITWDFQTNLWEESIDLTKYDPGNYTIWFNATDVSGTSRISNVNITIIQPFSPLLGMQLEATRTLSTQLYHTDEVRDDFTVTNNGSAPITALEFFLPEEYGVRMLDIAGIDGSGNELVVVRLDDFNGLYHWRVYLYEAVDFQEVYSFTIKFHFHSLHTNVDFVENLYEVTFPKSAMVPYLLKRTQLTLAFRSGDSLPGSIPSPEGTWQNAVPMQDEEFTFTMRSFTPLIVAERTTDINLNPWGWLNYHETITLKNLGNTKENSFVFHLPTYVPSSSVKIYDEVGILAASQPSGTWDINTTVDLNINLLLDRFGDQAFWPGFTYTFNIEYTVQSSGHTSTVSGGELVDLPLGTLGDVLLTTHEINIVVPTSVGIQDGTTQGYRTLHGVFDTTLQYTLYNSTKYNSPDISLLYSISFAASTRPLIFAMFIGLVAGVYVLARRVDFIEGSDTSGDSDGQTDTRQDGAPPELLSDFAKTYSRKTALAMDHEKLEAARRKGKVTKKEFMIRDRDLKSQIQELDSKLPSLKGTLMQHGTRYRDLISQLELQDEKIEGAKAGLRQLLIRKKKQRISRAAFEKSRQDYLKTIKRATTATDRLLMTIQEEAGEI